MAKLPADSDVVVLGDAPAAALSAVLLATAKRRVTWVVPDPPRGVDADAYRDLAFGPWLFPGNAAATALTRVLDTAELLPVVDARRLPVNVQLLDDRLRATLPGPGKGGGPLAPELDTLLGSLAAVTSKPRPLGIFGRRSLAGDVSKLASPSLSERPSRAFEGAAQVLDGRTPDTLPGKVAPFTQAGGVRLLAAPHLFPGGGGALVELLKQRAGKLGVELVHGPLDGLVRGLDSGWSDVSLELAGRGVVRARVLLDGVDRLGWGRAWGGVPGGLQASLTAPPKLASRGGLQALRLVVRALGLPVPLGPVAVVADARPILLERRRRNDASDTLLAWTRVEAGESATDVAKVLETRLGAVLPFHEAHVEQRGALSTGSHDPGAPWWPGGLPRRVLRATGVPGGLDGWEGAAVLAEHLLVVAGKLSPLPK